jgi:NTE family protein
MPLFRYGPALFWTAALLCSTSLVRAMPDPVTEDAPVAPTTALAGATADPVLAPPSTGRARIGLVLSGGGARGAAHVGVIRALEEMHIPIDAVAGTSMGAVVGGLYAAGLDGAEIEAVFNRLEWADLFRDRAPRRDLVYRRKQDDRGILAPGALGVRHGEGVVLPIGLVQGQKITQALRAATLRVGTVQDFDRLPTPFRALATDLETGDAVVLRSGDLATVLRASMSAPGVLAPVEINGRLLVDGGLVDNLPVRLAREMNVDVLIVVDVSFPLAKRSDLQSPFDVTNQMIAIMVRRGTTSSRAMLRAQDVLIEPNLGGMTSLDFDRVPAVMDTGRQTTLAARDQLESLSLDADAWQRYVAARRLPDQPDVIPKFVRAVERSQADAAKVAAVFGDLAQKPLDPRELQKRANREYGLDQYESVDYRLVEEAGEEGLELDLRRKSWGPNFLRLGLSIESDYDGGSRANAAAQLRLTDLNRLDADWLLQAQLGEEPAFFTEYFQPLSRRSDFFFAPSARHKLQTLQIVDDGHQLARYRIRETEAAFAIGAELKNWGEVRVGVRRGDGSTHVLVGDPTLSGGDFDIGGAYFEFGYDRLDSAYFPSQGQAFRARWLADRESLGSSISADVVSASWQLARSIDRYSVVLSLDAGSALDDRVNSPQELFTLGGFLELSGLPRDALAGTQFGLARAVVYRRVSRGGTGLFEYPAYMGFSIETGNVWQTRDDVDASDLELGGSIFLGADSPFGPIYLAAGLGESGEQAFYLLLGKTF